MRSFTTRQTTRLFSLTLLTLAFGLLQAQAKTDFSGTWKLNPGKSDFGQMPAPDSRTDKITHQDPSLKTNVTSSGGMGDATYDLSYTTDGKECVNQMFGNDVKSIVKWDGDDLTIDSKGSFGGSDFTAKARWNLSADGKTLTVTTHFSSGMGEGDVKEVFDKQ